MLGDIAREMGVGYVLPRLGGGLPPTIGTKKIKKNYGLVMSLKATFFSFSLSHSLIRLCNLKTVFTSSFSPCLSHRERTNKKTASKEEFVRTSKFIYLERARIKGIGLFERHTVNTSPCSNKTCG